MTTDHIRLIVTCTTSVTRREREEILLVHGLAQSDILHSEKPASAHRRTIPSKPKEITLSYRDLERRDLSCVRPPFPGPLSTFSVSHPPPSSTLVSFSTSTGNPALTLSKGRKRTQRRGAIVGGGSSVSFVRKTSDAGFVIPALTVQADGIGDHGVFLQG